MNKIRFFSLLVVAVMTVPTVVTAAPPAIPATPAAVDALIYARPFALDGGYTFDWRDERPQVTSGILLVLKVDRDLVYPRQVAEPVLFVGDQTAERVNIGYRSGYVVAIVPGDVDLTKSPIWFGTPELPERVGENTIRAERALAESNRIRPFPAEVVKAALNRGGKNLQIADREGLLRHAGQLITKYSPAENELAESLLVTAE